MGEDSLTNREHVGEEWDTHPLFPHSSPTTHPQIKEGSTSYFQKKGHGGTGSPVAAPPAPEEEGKAFEANAEGAAACLGFIKEAR